jgi:hypothetical protein
MERQLVAICGQVELELLFSARGPAQLRRMRQQLATPVDYVNTVEDDYQRAMDVMQLLAERGWHRAANVADLVIAAVAERVGLSVLHYDADFERIAEVTGQAMEWVVPQGAA